MIRERGKMEFMYICGQNITMKKEKVHIVFLQETRSNGMWKTKEIIKMHIIALIIIKKMRGVIILISNTVKIELMREIRDKKGYILIRKT